MSNTPTSETASETDRPDDEPDRQADAMKDQLRKDVASWSAARSGASTRQADEFNVPVVQAVRQPSLQPAKRVRRAKPIAPEAKPLALKKPFSMSYDGVTQEDYITYMIARGTR
jgi:hypothetical protein